MEIHLELILGATIDSETICEACLTVDDLHKLTRDDILTSNEIFEHEMLYFCDRCKKQLRVVWSDLCEKAFLKEQDFAEAAERAKQVNSLTSGPQD